MKRFALLLILLAGVVACAGDEPAGTPSEVASLLARRGFCDRWQGMASDPQGSLLDERIQEACAGTREQMAALRIKYADRPEVLQQLEKAGG